MRILRKVGIAVAVLVVLALAAAFVWPSVYDVKTGATPEYTDLEPQRFSAPHEQVYAAAVATVQALGWQITDQDPEDGEIQAVATTAVFHVKNDVTVGVGRDGDEILVTVRSRSRSRIGMGDLGANARRIRLFQAGLAERLGS